MFSRVIPTVQQNCCSGICDITSGKFVLKADCEFFITFMSAITKRDKKEKKKTMIKYFFYKRRVLWEEVAYPITALKC